jgi:hypothetical protein
MAKRKEKKRKGTIGQTMMYRKLKIEQPEPH